MTFGYSTNAFVRFSLEDSLRRIAALGFGGAEIMADRPHLYPPDFDPAAIARLQDVLSETGLKITNLNSFTLFAVGDTYLPSWIEPEPERRRIRVQHTRDCLNVAKAMGCGNISVPPGGPLPAGMSRSRALGLFHRELEKTLPLAEQLDVRILVEPEPDLLMERTAEIKSFVTDVACDHVGINFDIGHFFCAYEDPAAAFEELLPWIGHVHVEDIGADRRHQHLIAGEGAIAFAQVFATMARLGYTGDISLELYPYTDRPEEAGRLSRDFLLPVLAQSGLAID